jgi:hypothetical protein
MKKSTLSLDMCPEHTTRSGIEKSGTPALFSKPPVRTALAIDYA